MIDIDGRDEDFFVHGYQQLTKACDLPGVDAKIIKTVLNDFVRIYKGRTVTDNSGGAGEYPSAWLFLMAALFNPKLIVESGVWKGHTSWLFRNACPNAEIHSFDI
ncbi:MAG: hypothetical protein OQK32_04520, partial [Gammaproteobacteria bacterium]|nr:hypothetical protein [Gammaproteobacteria bacterium]